MLTWRCFQGVFIFFSVKVGSRTRVYFSVRQSKICRWETVSRPHFTFLSKNLSLRAGLETTFHFFIAEFVAKRRSRNHISLFYRRICRWETVSRPHFNFLLLNLSQRAILETTFHFFIAEFVAEGNSRDHIFLFYRWICRWETVSEPHFTFLLLNLSLRDGLGTTFHFFIAEFVAEGNSRDHISLFYRWICRWETVSEPHFNFLSLNLSLRDGLETTFQFFIAEFVAERRSRDHIFLF